MKSGRSAVTPELACAGALLLRTGCTNLEPVRRYRSLVCVAKAGSLTKRCSDLTPDSLGRHSDGGWRDVEETVWALAFLDIVELWSQLPTGWRQESIEWLQNERTTDGAWGRSVRDMSRIPVTGWAMTLLPELADERALAWLEAEWKRDLAAATKLTYKGALTLKAFASVGGILKDAGLIKQTVEYLVSEQNEDGGFGPWKDHPIGSEPWSTGIALIGLAAWPDLVPSETLGNALVWLGEKQLPNGGLWSCHYIEEGSAYCYWGAVEAMKLLKRRGNFV